MRTIGVVTTSRADYGVYIPILRAIQSDPNLKLHLLVSGSHLSPEFGSTIRFIEDDGFPIGQRVEMLIASDTPEAVAKSMGLGTLGFAQAYASFRPDLLLVLGDRFEMHSAALAALPFKIPVAHIHGGEITEGAIDDALRHSMTKLSHLHFVSSQEYGQRVEQLGEEPWRITVSGAPSLDNLRSTELVSRNDLESRLALTLEKDPLLITYHPVTLEYEQTGWHVEQLLEALGTFDVPLVFTAPNADTSGRTIRQTIERFVEHRSSACLVDNLGTEHYFSLMSLSAAMVGNSSSGMLEAALFGLPVVNIGSRQKGRVRTGNIIDVGYNKDDILAGIKKAVSSEFKSLSAGITSPWGDGHASERIIDVLKSVKLGDSLVTKSFVDCFQVPELAAK